MRHESFDLCRSFLSRILGRWLVENLKSTPDSGDQSSQPRIVYWPSQELVLVSSVTLREIIINTRASSITFDVNLTTIAINRLGLWKVRRTEQSYLPTPARPFTWSNFYLDRNLDPLIVYNFVQQKSLSRHKDESRDLVDAETSPSVYWTGYTWSV